MRQATPTGHNEADLSHEGSNTEKREIQILIHKDTEIDNDKVSILPSSTSARSGLSIHTTKNNHLTNNNNQDQVPLSPITLPTNDTLLANTPLPSPQSLNSFNSSEVEERKYKEQSNDSIKWRRNKIILFHMYLMEWIYLRIC